MLKLGRVVATKGASTLTTAFLTQCLDRHCNGEVCPWENRRILSVYLADNGAKVYIITEADRSTTTLMLAEEY